MRKANPEDASSPEASRGGAVPNEGTSPYATGGGGVTFERKVAVQYLAHLLTGDGASELGDGRCVTGIAFQQAPAHPVDDLVVSASGETQPSLLLALGIRRSPKIVKSDESTRKLIDQFVRSVLETPSAGQEHRLGLVVSGPQPHAQQLAELAAAAATQSDPAGFFDLLQTPRKFDSALRDRLDHLEELVAYALLDRGVAGPDTKVVQERTWQLLSKLNVLMPRLETPDETDWARVTNSLRAVVDGADLAVASQLRDHLVALASDYSPQAACVDLTMVRRTSHVLLDATVRRHKRGWQRLNSLSQQARDSVQTEIAEGDGGRSMRLDRHAAAKELLEVASSAEAVVVSGESGVGKSALAVVGLADIAEAERDRVQVLCINLRHVPDLPMTLEGELGDALSTLLSEMSAPQRVLVIDGADATTEGKQDAFRYLANAAQDSDVKVVAVTSIDSREVVRRTITEHGNAPVTDHFVDPLNDSEIEEVVDTFSELQPLAASPRSRELLRRLVVVDLLVRGQVSGTPVTDADAMNEVWFGLVRRREMADRGSPEARETALLRLAELELDDGDRLSVIDQLDPAALKGLRRDGLLRSRGEASFRIGPDFAHDEVRRYAVARLLLATGNPASRLRSVGAPRWSLAAARLACQAWFAQPETSIPLKGRFAEQQASFDALVGEGHGSRWGDVPSEALLKLVDAEPLLRDAWPELLADEAEGLRRLVRVANQRHSKHGIIDTVVAEPIVVFLLEDPAPWRTGEYAKDLLRDWLCGHVSVGTAAGHQLRVQLRQHLVDACVAAGRRLAEGQEAAAVARAARKPNTQRWWLKPLLVRLIRHVVDFCHRFGQVRRQRELIEQMASQSLHSMSVDYGRRHRRRPNVPHEVIDETVLELLALLGPDVGDDGEAILRRVATDAPWHLDPAVDRPFTGMGLANGPEGLLVDLTEAYYLDDECDGIYPDDGVRGHRRSGLGVPLAAWYYGPFMALFRTDFRSGAAMLNRLLNHAARNRARALIDLGPDARYMEHTVRPYESELRVSGSPRLYIGDDHVWRWYRGNAVGPYPCMSALQALERACDQELGNGVPIQTLVSIMLDGCENLAMVGLIVGILVRHLEGVGDLLDPYFTEPAIWSLEFARVVSEVSPLSADSKEVVAPERRNWSLREAAQFLVPRASGERIAVLRTLGETLTDNKRRLLYAKRDLESTQEDIGRIDQELAVVRGWASSLDRSRYTAHKAPDDMDGIYIQFTPPDDVVLALAKGQDDAKLANEAMRLFVRYSTREQPVTPIGPDELTADVSVAKKLLANTQSIHVHNPLDPATLVAAAVLEARLIERASFADAALSFAAETMIGIGEGAARPRDSDFEGTFFEERADRSAARVLPLLLLPLAASTRALIDEESGLSTFERVFRASVNLARAVANEVRLHLARGLDHVWKASCVEQGHCHHELGLQIAAEMMRYCVLGPWSTDTGQRAIALEEPFVESLAGTAADSILVSRLDGAIRALAPATVADCCVSAQARDLLLALLAAQRRSLLHYQHQHGDPDPRESHALVSARALLTLARDGDDTAIYQHVHALAGNSTLLGKLLRSLSAAAEETGNRAATAKRIWPDLVRYVLDLYSSGRMPLGDSYYNHMALAALIPNPAGELPYLYREVNGDPIVWWDPLELRYEVEEWLALAAGNATCVDQLIGFVRAFDPDNQVRVGLRWVAKIVLADPASVASGTYMLTTWLIETRSAAVEAGSLAEWQKVVDAMVVAGDSRLAPYSD